MPRKKDDEYDSFDDEDDDDTFLRDLRLADPSEGEDSRTLKLPTKLWAYDYITGSWKDSIVFRGIGDRRAKSFLSEENLVNGSEDAGMNTLWSDGHTFWEGVIEATGQKGIFFSGEAIDELCNLLCEQVIQTEKAVIKPDPSKALHVKGRIEPGTLRPIKPADVLALRDLLESVKGDFFSLVLTKSRLAWSQIQQYGGSALAIKTQRFETDNRIVLEVGWSWLLYTRDREGVIRESDEAQHMVLLENSHYRNGAKLPNNRNDFGFGTTAERTEEAIIEKLERTFAELTQLGPVMLIFHNATDELAYLSHEMDVSSWRSDFPGDVHRPLPAPSARGSSSKSTSKSTSAPRFPVIIQDTQRLYAAYRADPQYAQVALSRACSEEGMGCSKHYNAGNDSYYMLQLYDLIMRSSGSSGY